MPGNKADLVQRLKRRQKPNDDEDNKPNKKPRSSEPDLPEQVQQAFQEQELQETKEDTSIMHNALDQLASLGDKALSDGLDILLDGNVASKEEVQV